jgi:hypothetical protein
MVFNPPSLDFGSGENLFLSIDKKLFAGLAEIACRRSWRGGCVERL